MRADEFEDVWRTLVSLFPRAQALRDELTKIEWAGALDQYVAAWVKEAAKAHAEASEWPSLAGLLAEYGAVSARHLEARRLEALPIGTALPMKAIPMEHYDRAYEALPAAQRAALEERLKVAYYGAYGRRDEPHLGWAWRCLVVTAAEQGVGADGRVLGIGRRSEEEEEAVYQANFRAAQQQMLHEATCVKCKVYSEGPQAPTKANPTRERRGAPCPVGAAFWEPHWAAGMARPTA